MQNNQQLLSEVTQIKTSVKSNPELKAILDQLTKNIIADQSLPELSVKFDNQMSTYLLTHKFKAPSSVLKLQEKLKKYAEEYHGGISLSTSLSTSFSIFK